jgi:heptosyltransferase-1
VIRRVVLVKLSAIGDVVHALPLARALRRAHPDAEITWIVERRAASVLEGLEAVNRRLVIDTRAPRAAFRKGDLAAALGELRAMGREVRELRADWAIDAQGLLKSGVIAWMTRAPLRTGFPARVCREPASALFTNHHPPVRPGLHVIETLLELLGPGWQPPAPDDLRLPVSAAELAPFRVWAECLRPVSGGLLVAVNPAASWETKRWPVGHFAEALWGFARMKGLRLVVLWGPGERPLAERLVATLGGNAVLAPGTTIRELYCLLAQCDLFVGCDTGPLHLAAAAGVPVLGLFGPTDPARNGPYGRGHSTIWLRRACAPCHKRTCDRHGQCLESLLPETVAEALGEMIEGARAGRMPERRLLV